MASYSIFFKPSAEKELRKISSPYLGKVIDRISSLSHNPRPSGVQMLKGENRYFRFRFGDYRIIYDVNDRNERITVIKIGHRREVYE